MGRLGSCSQAVSKRLNKNSRVKKLLQCYHSAIFKTAVRATFLDSDGVYKTYEQAANSKWFKIDNGIEVFVVHDQDPSNPCAASLSVSVGSFNDPEFALGLAHLLEHCLFHRSKKYPEFGALPEFIRSHDGRYTAPEETNYQFTISKNVFDKALDMFANQFIDPMFDEESIVKEISVVDNEHSKNHGKDLRRIFDFINLFSGGDEHPLGRFHCGNYESLKTRVFEAGKNIQEEVVNFFHRFYMPAKMKLCIVGPYSLESLEDLAKALFSGIKPKRQGGSPIDIPRNKPFPPHRVGKLLHVVPFNESTKTITISWMLPSLIENHLSYPHAYLTAAFLDEGPTSLIGNLKAKGWVSNVFYHIGKDFRDFSILTIVAECTEYGIECHKDNIISAVFGYIGILKEGRTNFNYFLKVSTLFVSTYSGPVTSKKMENIEKATTIAKQMQFYPKQYILTGGYFAHSYDPNAVSLLLDALVPNKANVCVFQQSAEMHARLTEVWYDAKYSVNLLSSKYTDEEWQIEFAKSLGIRFPKLPSTYINTGTSMVFQKPIPVAFEKVSNYPLLKRALRDHIEIFLNDWMPFQSNEDRSHVENLVQSQPEILKVKIPVNEPWTVLHDSFRPPALLKYSQSGMVWLKQTTDIAEKQVFLSMVLQSNWCIESSFNRLAAGIYLKYIFQKLLPLYCKMGLSNSDLALKVVNDGISIRIVAYQDNGHISIYDVLNKVLKTLTNPLEDFNPQMFRSLKAEYLSESTVSSHPLAEASSNSSAVLFDPYDSKYSIRKKTAQIKFRDISVLPTRIFQGARAQILVTGNASPTTALTVYDMVQRYIAENSQLRVENPRRAVVKLNDGVQNYFIVPSVNKNSSVDIKFQIGKMNDKMFACSILFSKLINGPCFDFFRTTNGIAYVVYVQAVREMKISFVNFQCLSKNADPIQLDTKFEEFLDSIVEEHVLSSMNEEKFEEAKASTINSLFEINEGQHEEEHMIWTRKVVTHRNYELFLRFDLADEIKKLQKSDFLRFYEKYISRFGCKRRKLVSGVVSSEHMEQIYGINKSDHNGFGLEEELLQNVLEAARSRGPIHCIVDPNEYKYTLEECELFDSI